MLAPESWHLIITFLSLQHGWYWMQNYYIHNIQHVQALHQLSIRDSSPCGCCSRQVFKTFSINVWHGWTIFYTEWYFNFCNMNTWCYGSLYSIQATCFQHQFAINSWVTVNDDLTSPYKLLPQMSRDSYLCFVMENLPLLLGEVQLETWHTSWFVHDGCPAHFSCDLKQFLDSITQTERFCGPISLLLTSTYAPNLRA